jgi:hypothetical protein
MILYETAMRGHKVNLLIIMLHFSCTIAMINKNPWLVDSKAGCGSPTVEHWTHYTKVEDLIPAWRGEGTK